MDNIKLDPNMGQSLTIRLADGRHYSLRGKETLGEIDEKQEAIFLFDNGQLYNGLTDGKVDDEGDFALFRPNSKAGIALPFRRLVGWEYKQAFKDPLLQTREMFGILAEQVSRDFGIDLHSVRFKRNEEGRLTEILLNYEERETTESGNGNPQPEGERK